MEIFESLEPLLKTFWFIAIPASIIFIIQTIMTFVGTDASDGLSADFDGDMNGGDAPFQLFSFRNLINFLLGFGWAGVSFFGIIGSPVILILVAVLIGCSFVLLFFVIISQLLKLAEDDSFKMEQAISKTAEVYLTIPGGKQGKGKILISVNGSVRELDAMTEGDKLTTNTLVKVIKVENKNILIVEKI